ncbi:11226_t:CDS:2 [Funneliformis mosseae]|uniref:11226_t:CDS:1 n=1 Tax=Funneliformis mosseae TaxID=27381 RepID=A0A9N8VSD9_FUNMO|nr:11226_t:CDS:2 [Funneliformis mosseae]
MIDVVAHSVSLDQHLDYPVHFQQQQYFTPSPSSFATTTPSLNPATTLDFNSASFGGFDLTGEQFIARPLSACVNFFDIQNWPTNIFAMNFPPQPYHQQSAQGLPNSSTSSRHFNDMTSTATFHHQYVDETSAQQAAMLQPDVTTPSFVEPSTNYFALPATTSSSLHSASYYSPPSSLPPQANPVISNLETETNNLPGSRNTGGYIGNFQSQSHPRLRMTTNNPTAQLINAGPDFTPSHHYLPQREIYQGAVPTSIGRVNHQAHHQKTISEIGASNNYSRQSNVTATSLPVTGTTSIAPQINSPSSSSGVWSTKTSSAQTSPSLETVASPTTPTYYSGPPRSYYSRLPLYDRPFKCDQCPQSFNRNHDLKRHKRIHLAVKPYPCQCCDKQFSRKDALKRHILVKGCNNTKNNKKTTSPNTGDDKKVEESSTKQKYTSSPIESYVNGGNSVKSESTKEGVYNNTYGNSSI